MRITREQAKENKARIVAMAARLFREKGFQGVGVSELMHAAGLTHGGFYNHFESKSQLEEEACALSFVDALAPVSHIALLETGSERRAAFASHIENYLAARARTAPAPRCPFVAFGSDMPRQDERTRRAFGKGLRQYLDTLGGALKRKAKKSEQTRADAIFSLAAMVGALTLARGVDQVDEHLSEEILGAVRERLLKDLRG